jgi:hypothetical protein
MAGSWRKFGFALAAVAILAVISLVAMTSGWGLIGPNQGDIVASHPAFPGGSVTFTVTVGNSCDHTSSFTPPNSTIKVLNQAGTTTITGPTDIHPTATGGTLTVTLPNNLALGTYTMQFLCNHNGGSSIFGRNEFSVTAAPATTTTTAPPSSSNPAPAPTPVSANPALTG